MDLFINIFIYEFVIGLIYSLLLHPSKRANNIYLLMAFSPLIIFQIFKDPYSLPDLPFYIMGFEGVENMSIKEILNSGAYINQLKAEPTWFIFNKFIHVFSNNIIILFAIVGLFTLLGYFRLIKKYSPYLFLSIILYFVGPFYQSLYVIRQHLAIAIFYFSLQYIIKGNLKAFLITICIGFCFHQSIIAVIPVYFLYQISNNKKLTFMLIIFNLSLALLFEVLLDFIVQYYVGHEKALYDDANYKIVLVYTIILLIRMAVLKYNFYEEGPTKILSLLCVMTFILSFSGMTFASIDRLNMYFSNASCVYLPQTISKISNKPLRLALILIILGFWLIIFFVRLPKSDIANFQLINLN